jgi:hypothetical protein
MPTAALCASASNDDGEGSGHVGRNGQTERRLAHPTRPGQGQQWHGVVEQERAGRRSLGRATDESGAGEWGSAEADAPLKKAA